ncbi:MAG: class I SAM-dependent methyltransferase [Planctomycetes bacterium]|nr:class I SAM-dependent methyltransferase [Planctomycetota bacterium]
MQKLAFEVEPSNRRFRLRLARYVRLAEALAERLPREPSWVLDAGCGRGRLPLYWTRWGDRSKAVRFAGVDLERRGLAQARPRGYAVLLRSDLRCPWPFGDGAFQAVVCEQVLEHLSPGEARFVLGEVRRVLAPGGFALAGTPVFGTLAIILEPLWRRLNPAVRALRRQGPAQHLQHLRLREVRRFLEEGGFTLGPSIGSRLFALCRNGLEDRAWYYRAHRWAGERFPGLCVEATTVAYRRR